MKKETYCAPTLEVIELYLENVIATSQNVEMSSTPNNEDWTYNEDENVIEADKDVTITY